MINRLSIATLVTASGLLASCGGTVEFSSKGATSQMGRPATDDIVKEDTTPLTPKSDTSTKTETLPSDFVIGSSEANELPPPAPFVPSWGSLQLYSSVDQFEFVASTAQGWLASLVADHSDSTHLASVLNVLSFVNVER